MKTTVIMGFLTRKAVITICRLMLAAIFLAAALGKIANPKEFSDSVAAYRMLPITWVNIIAIVLPWVELVIGLALVSGIQTRQAALLSVLLNAVFIIAAISAMSRGLDIECGCFTVSKAHSNVGWMLLARDMAFVFLGAVVMKKAPEWIRTER
jgi:putative oxidoreductase